MCKVFPPLPVSTAVTQPEQPHVSPAGSGQSAILNFTPAAFDDKPRLKLPPTQDEWEEANCYFSQVLAPQILTEASPDSKNTVLCEGTFLPSMEQEKDLREIDAKRNVPKP